MRTKTLGFDENKCKSIDEIYEIQTRIR